MRHTNDIRGHAYNYDTASCSVIGDLSPISKQSGGDHKLCVSPRHKINNIIVPCDNTFYDPNDV